MKYLITTIIFSAVLLGNANAESSNIKKYKKNYEEQLIPLLKERMGTETKMETQADAHEHVSTIAKRMADCQLLAIEGYPQKYQDASIEPIINGADIRKTTNDVNELIKTDIKNGELSEQEFKTMTEAATEKYKVCLSYPE